MTDITSFHADRLAQAHQRLDQHDGRLSSLESHVAVATERDRHIQQSLSDIKGGVTWITRLVLGGIVMGALAFLIAGGFSVGG